MAQAIWPIFEEWANILVRIWPEKSGCIDRAMTVGGYIHSSWFNSQEILGYIAMSHKT